MKRARMLPLPGVSKKDPNFYDGAQYNDRARFAQPVHTGAGVSEAAGPSDASETPDLNEEDAKYDGSDFEHDQPSPFRLGGTR